MDKVLDAVIAGQPVPGQLHFDSGALGHVVPGYPELAQLKASLIQWHLPPPAFGPPGQASGNASSQPPFAWLYYPLEKLDYYLTQAARTKPDPSWLNQAKQQKGSLEEALRGARAAGASVPDGLLEGLALMNRRIDRITGQIARGELTNAQWLAELSRLMQIKHDLVAQYFPRVYGIPFVSWYTHLNLMDAHLTGYLTASTKDPARVDWLKKLREEKRALEKELRQANGLAQPCASTAARSRLRGVSSPASSGSPTLIAIAVLPTTPTLTKGATQQFTATGSCSDGSTRDLTMTVTWASSNAVVATISNSVGTQGQATATAHGTTTISATSDSLSGSTTLTVTSPPPTLTGIAVSPSNPTITNGMTQQFTATGSYSDGSTQNLTTTVTWASSNTSVATISNVAGSQGWATGTGAGSTTISAGSDSVSGSATLTVTCQLHSNGIGYTYSDCSPLGTPGNPATYSQTMANEAAAAWQVSPSMALVINCSGQPAVAKATPSQAAVWAYTGNIAGYVHLNNSSTPVCPTTADGTWN